MTLFKGLMQHSQTDDVDLASSNSHTYRREAE